MTSPEQVESAVDGSLDAIQGTMQFNTEDYVKLGDLEAKVKELLKDHPIQKMIKAIKSRMDNFESYQESASNKMQSIESSQQKIILQSKANDTKMQNKMLYFEQDAEQIDARVKALEPLLKEVADQKVNKADKDLIVDMQSKIDTNQCSMATFKEFQHKMERSIIDIKMQHNFTDSLMKTK